ncbi:MAG: TSUP family transporter [Aquificaceae bacterium]
MPIIFFNIQPTITVKLYHLFKLQLNDMKKKFYKNSLAFFIGFFTATLGGLIGLGGAEFRLPFLIKLFDFLPLQAVIINKAVSLVVVSSSFFSRLSVIPLNLLLENLYIVLNLLSGSLLGAWIAADWAIKVHGKTLQRVIAVLLVFIALVLFMEGHIKDETFRIELSGIHLYTAGTISGFFIGMVAGIMGVAGGELLIPTIILLYSLNIKLAGSLSLMVSIPTMVFAFARYSRDRSFSVLKENLFLLLFMVLGSFLGSFVGGHLLLGRLSEGLILNLLIIVLLLSSYKVWQGVSKRS